MNAPQTKGPGRPVGSKNIETVVHVVTPACPKCGSHDRTKYEGSTSQVAKGVLIDGRRYSKAVRRRCRCANPDCNEPRIEEWIEISSE